MDDYPQKQLKLIQKIEEKFKKGESPSTIVKPVNDYENDNRTCLTAVVFLPQSLEQKILDEIILPLKKADSRQYFYVPDSFHLTIQNIRTIENPPLFTNEDIEKAKKVFENVIPKYPTIAFNVKRLFELPTSLSLSAFCDERLGDLIRELKNELEIAGVADNKSYASDDIALGNITIVRFTTEPNNMFKKKVEGLKKIEIGNFTVSKVFLVTTNCVCIKNKTNIIQEYTLV